jgi:phage terminase large subunit GpA-like protein
MANIPLKILASDERPFLYPPEKIDILQWVERRQYLPAKSEESGPIRLDRTPYLRPWLLAAVDDSIEEIIICASAQVAKTTFGMAVGGFYTDVMTAPVLFCLADENTAKFISRHRIRKMFEDSPEINYLISGAPVVNNDEIELANGGYVGIGWASSVAALATREFRVVIGDEIDKPGYKVKTEEATPLSLLRERTESFYNFKHIFFSTPTLESGNVTVELKSCDVIYDWHVPCPYCGVYQPMRFTPEHAYGFKDGQYLDPNGKMRPLGRVAWDGGSSATPDQVRAARYECGSCGGHWTTAMKNRAVMHGKSVPRGEAPESPRKVGFHINRLYSLLGKSGHLDRIVDKFLNAKQNHDPRVLQGFMNSTLAEPYLPAKKIRKTDSIMKLRDARPRGVVPGGGVVACLLAGVDTQDDGFFYEIRAFGYGIEKESWCIQEGKVPSFGALEQVLWENEYKDTDDNIYPVRLTLQDSAGHRTAEVYDFCKRHPGKIFPTKGVQNMASPYRFNVQEHMPNGKPIPGGIRLYRLDTTYYKNMLAGILEIKPGDPGCFWYNKDLTRDWARQMTVEILNDRGIWENPHGRANHAWDCAVLLLMAHEIAMVSRWKKPTDEKKKNIEPKNKPEKIKLW